MPPTSPVWTWSYATKKREFFDTGLRLRVKIGGAVYESNEVRLRVEGAKRKEK